MGLAALLLLAVVTLLSLPLWVDKPAVLGTRAGAGVLVGLAVTVLAVAAWLAVSAGGHGRGELEVAVALAILASVAGGGPLARAALRLADPGFPGPAQGPARTDVLTGGAWIGALERVAVTATLLAGWPEGLALVLAVKGLGRYPELRAAGHADQSGAAERFIVGTFASGLWAAACAAVGLAFLRGG
jgi:hypothetical protein